MRVACPWFEPVHEADMTDRIRPARAVLGKMYEGWCHSSGGEIKPAGSDLCNFGYGRDRCPDFPASGEADAVRFTVQEGRLIWILEKNYGPLQFGFCDQGTPGPLILRQAEAFTKSCSMK